MPRHNHFKFKGIAKRLCPSRLARFYVPKKDGAVALTFDDGPHYELTREILNSLEEYDCTATFFVLGKNAEKSPALIREIIDRGHEIGNHGYSHPDIRQIGIKGAMEDLRQGERVLRRITGLKQFVYRPPNGYINSSFLLLLLREHGVGPVLWSKCVDKEWQKSQSALRVAFQELHIEPGDIVLLHDVNANTAFLLPDFLREIYSFEYKAKSLERLLAAGNVTVIHRDIKVMINRVECILLSPSCSM